jgi:colicin import membrane protein
MRLPVSQDVEVQLKVWKDLAISKQILMGAATDALGLNSECTTDELKTALNEAIKRAREADKDIQETRAQAEQQVSDFRQRAEAAERARVEAEEQAAAALEARAQAERQLAAGKADNAEALKKARAEVTDKQNKLKAISKALADTPENVVRKLKTLKKQKMDEAKLRGQAETRLQKMRKEKSTLEAELATQKSTLESVAKLLDQVKAMRETCLQAKDTIKGLSDKKKDQLILPEFDETAFEELRKALLGEEVEETAEAAG